MTILQRLFGLYFPDPEVGQVWRSRHSGRAIRVAEVRRSDCGRMWHIALHHEDAGGFIAIPMSYCMFPSQWRRMLRDEGRQLMGGGIEPPKPWPRHGGNVNPPPDYPRPPAPPRPRPMVRGRPAFEVVQNSNTPDRDIQLLVEYLECAPTSAYVVAAREVAQRLAAGVRVHGEGPQHG